MPRVLGNEEVINQRAATNRALKKVNTGAARQESGAQKQKRPLKSGR
jgi:hypothetical protein